MNRKIHNTFIISGILTLVTLFIGILHTTATNNILIAFIFVFSLAIFLVSIPFMIVSKIRSLRQPKPDSKVNRKLMAQYQKAGLSESDIVFFRKTMGEAEGQIRQLDKNISETPKLKAIDLNSDFVKVSKSMFAAIVKEPDRLSEASDFLYRHLPTLVNLTDRYIEISHHEVKTADTWEVLAKSLDVITNLGNQIREDYAEFVSDDLNEMDQEMTAANDSLSTAQKDAIKMNEALDKVNESYEKNKEKQDAK